MVYKNKIVRDLDFVINSPDLIISEKHLSDFRFGKSNDEIASFLRETDFNPANLNNFIGNRSAFRLGRYFEQLVHYYLDWNSNVELIAVSLQIFDGKTTIGEMDFILKDKTRNKFIHLETAVKYFAKKDGPATLYEYMCPNAQRNFGSKLDKTFSKQLLLSKTPQALEVLAEKGISEIESYVYIKGYLFYKQNDKSPEEKLINSGAIRKQWMHYSEISSLNKDHFYRVAPKIDWLSADIYENTEELMVFEELKEFLGNHFSELKQGLMLVEFLEKDGLFIETDKYFVLDNSWPDIDKSHFDYKKLIK